MIEVQKVARSNRVSHPTAKPLLPQRVQGFSHAPEMPFLIPTVCPMCAPFFPAEELGAMDAMGSALDLGEIGWRK
jgi:hypothetical protein